MYLNVVILKTNRVFPGTVAFGSLIIAILRMVRVMLEKVEEKLAKYHQDNKIVKAAMCVCKCCFWCLEKFMKFLNRNAYIMCAVSGNNFCTSAKASVTYYLVSCPPRSCPDAGRLLPAAA